MAHDHDHHEHNHSHGLDFEHGNRKAFVIGICLNLAFVLVEIVAGLIYNSMALLTDAGHNAGDVASLVLSLVAFWMAKKKSSADYTYGYKKTTVLVALFNAVVLLLSIGAIGYEALHRIIAPEPLPGKTISIVAAGGIVVNAVTALLFFRNKDHDLNIKSAFLHLMADAVVSAALVIGGILILFTGFYWIDAALSLLVGAVILFSTWNLLRDSLRLSLDAVPEGINLQNVQERIKKINGVDGFHHIHIWALSTSENALTAHVVVSKNTDMNKLEKLKHEIKHELFHLNIQHATLEIEMENAHCEEAVCEPKESSE